jgi:hypothetical protein
MDIIIFNPEHISIADVEKLEGFFVHPLNRTSDPWIYAVKGSVTQYAQLVHFYKECFIAHKICCEFDLENERDWSGIFELEERMNHNLRYWLSS